MNPALTAYGRVLREAARNESTPVDLVASCGTPLARLDASHWYADPRPGDDALLDTCSGRTLDIGCGPGRLVAALHRRGVPVLGIDISPEAVRQARLRGASAVLADVFDRVPTEGQWEHALLADGNIGIGGDPVRLLRRCRTLMAPAASVVCELAPPGSGSWRSRVRMSHNGALSPSFWWAAVAAEDITSVAREAGLRLLRTWPHHGRWFAHLSISA